MEKIFSLTRAGTSEELVDVKVSGPHLMGKVRSPDRSEVYAAAVVTTEARDK